MIFWLYILVVGSVILAEQIKDRKIDWKFWSFAIPVLFSIATGLYVIALVMFVVAYLLALRKLPRAKPLVR